MLELKIDALPLSSEEIQSEINKRKEEILLVQQGKIGDINRLGWFNLPSQLDEYLAPIHEAAEKIKTTATHLIVVGIGGSNRGSMAAIQSLSHQISSPVTITYAGDSLSQMHLQEALELVEKENVAINVIAKDFNTLEPGITFRLLRTALEKKYGAEYHKRVFVTGSKGPGQLYDVATNHGYHFLDFPDSFGGRFSVLSAVGLLPMAVAGVDLYRLFHGAQAAEHYLKSTEPEKNQGVIYAVTRNLLFQKNFTLESLVLFEPDLLHLGRWWVQLFAESEGKTEKAIFPVSFMYSDDLHAVGQYVQEGRRCIAETYLKLFHPNKPLVIPESPVVADGFNYLSGKEFQFLNETVYQAALEAHKNDGIPCTQFISETTICPEIIGYFFYYSFFVCYLSCVLLEVNPFDQEGVEGYKRNMYALLGKYTQES